MMIKSDIEKIKVLSRRDDCFNQLVPSDIRVLIADIEELQRQNEILKKHLKVGMQKCLYDLFKGGDVDEDKGLYIPIEGEDDLLLEQLGYSNLREPVNLQSLISKMTKAPDEWIAEILQVNNVSKSS